MNTAAMLREARQAVHQGDFVTARSLYANLRKLPELKQDVDVSLRFAYCAEQTGDFSEAIGAYQDVLSEYRSAGEDSAAEVLEDTLRRLHERIPGTAEDNHAGAEPAQELSDGDVISQLFEHGVQRQLAKGEVLCRHGDPPHFVWLLTKGELEVHVPDYEDKGKLTGDPTHPSLVGEIGFFTGQRRSATVVAASDARVIEVLDKEIHAQCERDPGLKAGMERLFRERLVERILSHHTVFERVNDVDRKRLAFAFKKVTLGPGEVLVEAGCEHNGTYLVQSGCLFLRLPQDKEAVVAENDNKDLVCSVQPGDIIHLGGLLRGFRSDYRVVTATPVELLHLTMEQFEPFTNNRPWIIQAILKHSRKPPSHQIMRPDEEYLWSVNRRMKIKTASWVKSKKYLHEGKDGSER